MVSAHIVPRATHVCAGLVKLDRRLHLEDRDCRDKNDGNESTKGVIFGSAGAGPLRVGTCRPLHSLRLRPGVGSWLVRLGPLIPLWCRRSGRPASRPATAA
jgi:hypothetical protein